MNLQILNGCAGNDPVLPTAGTDPGRRYMRTSFLVTNEDEEYSLYHQVRVRSTVCYSVSNTFVRKNILVIILLPFIMNFVVE
mgnify:CR=1 FL=1